jgi:hypothetical protein
VGHVPVAKQNLVFLQQLGHQTTAKMHFSKGCQKETESIIESYFNRAQFIAL